jgi:hypothetical protein
MEGNQDGHDLTQTQLPWALTLSPAARELLLPPDRFPLATKIIDSTEQFE